MEYRRSTIAVSLRYEGYSGPSYCAPADDRGFNEDERRVRVLLFIVTTSL
jgi:hypothetical protein